MEILYLAFAAFIIAAPLSLGAFMLLFSRRFSVGMYRQRKALWKIGFNESDVRVGQVFVVIAGAVLLIGSLIVSAQVLFS